MQQNIPEDKKQKIIDAAMQNFSKNGYKKTAVDEIVADAGISKGLIFHYFGSKKKLYLYLYELAYRMVYERVTKALTTAPSDLFERIRQSEQAKLEIVSQYPFVLDFLLSTRSETDAKLLEELEQIKSQSFPPWTESFFPGIDTFKLREDVTLDQAIKIILWCTNGLLEEHKNNFALKEVIAEMDAYLATLRRAFYKEEYV